MDPWMILYEQEHEKKCVSNGKDNILLVTKIWISRSCFYVKTGNPLAALPVFPVPKKTCIVRLPWKSWGQRVVLMPLKKLRWPTSQSPSPIQRRHEDDEKSCLQSRAFKSHFMERVEVDRSDIILMFPSILLCFCIISTDLTFNYMNGYLSCSLQKMLDHPVLICSRLLVSSFTPFKAMGLSLGEYSNLTETAADSWKEMKVKVSPKISTGQTTRWITGNLTRNRNWYGATSKRFDSDSGYRIAL